MKQSMLLCGIGTLGLFIQGCAQQSAPAPSAASATQLTPAVRAAAEQSAPATQPVALSRGSRLQRARECQYPRVSFNDSGGSVDISTSNEGGWCIISLHRYGLLPYQTVIVTTPPNHGELTTRNTDRTYLRYRPVAGYVGADKYIVDLIPGNVSFRANINVVP